MYTLKKKLKDKKITIGSWITIGNTSIAEIMAKAGYEWLTIDMEHSAIGFEQAQNLIQVIELCGVTPLVRVGENNPNIIKRVMDSGAHGVIVPMVNSKEDAIRAVESVRYPPVGARGVGLARAQGYGVDFDKYKDWLSRESVVIVQIEHIDAVENLEDILQVNGIDAFIVGPYDLSASLGRPGEFDHPDILSALGKIKDISKRFQKTAGYHIVPPKPGMVKEKIENGYTFIAYSVDFLFLGEKCRHGIDVIKKFI